MTTKRIFGQRFMSVFLTIAVLMTMLSPLSVMTASAEGIDNAVRVADPSTMNDWTKYFPRTGEISTENAGSVWMDKSVLTDAKAFAGIGITQDDPNSFLVALSAMASNISVTGMSNVPTDTILVLDVSGSMNDDNGHNDVAEDLVDAANESIAALLETNKYNRVGVVLYSGTSSSTTNYSDAAILLLPLGRYTTGTDGEYLNYSVTTAGGRRPGQDSDEGETTETVSLDTDVVYEGTQTKPASASKTVVGATYIQRGIITAMNEFVDEDNDIAVADFAMGALKRKPVLVLMSDGAPTLGSTIFTNPGYGQDRGYNLGNGSYTSAALGFVSQLSAAYAKAMIEQKYGTDALFYTLGLGIDNDSVAIGVMDPDNANASAALDNFWHSYNAIDTTDSLTTNDYVTVQSNPRRTVEQADIALEKNYVDKYFSAASETLPDGTVVTMADKLKAAFRDIVIAIQLQSAYFPTLISENEDFSGYISFEDKIGQYMEVTDIKGILINNQLFSGADLASNFVSGGGNLGTYDNPTELGIEMIAAVRARLGLDSDDTARTLIGLAYDCGQLSYTNENNYSNYIGWYANAQGEFLGFYHEGVTVLPEATGNQATDPAFVVKTYGYLGAVDESLGVSKSDMMYAAVHVREDIANGEQLVTFAVPAALIPVVTYNVTLDKDGNLSKLTARGAEHPIRLVYEVALRDGINSFNVKEKVSAEYLADTNNVNADGFVNFYTNRWDYENTTGLGTVNTYSYFNPSRQNNRYYYLDDTLVYSDTDGTLYTGSAQPSGTMYRAHTVYKSNGRLRTETIYRSISAEALATAVPKGDGFWYIPKSTVFVNLEEYTARKTSNPTETLTEANIPFVDTHNHSINEEGYDYYVGAVLGNNGRLTLPLETGIKLSKKMAEGATAPNKAFTFILTNISNSRDNKEYRAWLIKANGSEDNTPVRFTNGKATVQLNPNDTLYIGGMAAGTVFEVTEEAGTEYIVESTSGLSNGTVTAEANTIKPVEFVNADRGTGNLTIAKQVEHDFGLDYQIPADKTFDMTVTLSGVGTANATFSAEYTNGQCPCEIATDKNGQFTVTLKHGEQFELFGLPAGTTATVDEAEYSGFTPAYWDNGEKGDGIVTVVKDSTVSVIVVNDYLAEAVSPVNLKVSGTKTVNNEKGEPLDDWGSYEFKVILERCGANGWEPMADVTLNNKDRSYRFNLSEEEYSTPGVYSYRVYEYKPAIEESGRIDGMVYDPTLHTFSVYVGDDDMDGRLEIIKVVNDRTGKEIAEVGNSREVVADFVNTQSESIPALVTVEIAKDLKDNSKTDPGSKAGYQFGLYTNKSCTELADTNVPGVSKVERFATDTAGKGRIDIVFDEEGTYTFYIKEIDGGKAGMTYSPTVMKADIVIELQGTAYVATDVSYTKLTAAEKFDADGWNENGYLLFTNYYDPVDAELPISFVSKQIIGRAFKADDNFTFQIAETNLPEGRNAHKTITGYLGSDTDGDKIADVIFSENLHFNAVGIYFFDITEKGDDKNGITIDKTVCRIVVTVTDIGGELSASYQIVNAASNTFLFCNTYQAAPASCTIYGEKELTGRTLLNDEFTFVLTEVSFNGEAISNPASFTTKNFADGSFRFPEITYDKAGTYVYRVTEQKPSDSETYGITYDTAVYEITVTVTDDLKGSLAASEPEIREVGGTGSDILFENVYKPKKTSARIVGDKELVGKVDNGLSGGEYTFKLYTSNADWTFDEESEPYQTVENGADGIIEFTAVEFDKAGDYYYIVTEDKHGQTIDGVTYDDTVFRIYVDIDDDLKGQLNATVHIYDDANIPQDTIQFVNEYDVTGNITLNLSGEKTMEGRELTEDDIFRFELYKALDNEFKNLSSSAEYTATANAENGFKLSFNIPFSADDEGKTFRYVLIEENAGKTADGITYSNARYNILIKVKDNNVGGIMTEVDITDREGNPVEKDALDFVNTYKAVAADIDFKGSKTLDGIRELKANDFTFDLYKATEQFAIDGEAIASVKNDAYGDFLFENIPLDKAGVHRFIIKENSQEPIGGVTYDRTQYHISVTVVDNGKGSLTVPDAATIFKVTGENSESAKDITFVNSYNPDDATVSLGGKKRLDGRTMEEGEFRFLLYPANREFAVVEEAVALQAVNNAEGRFTFDALTFSEPGTYCYVIREDSTVDAQRITFDDSAYGITVTVTDNGNGKLTASEPTVVKLKSTDAVSEAEFRNTFTPKPADLTVNLDILKTVFNKGSDKIGPENFEFLLESLTEGAELRRVKSNADGKAEFALIFTEDDIGKTYTYKLTEVNGGRENVQYSTAEYTIMVTVSLNANNELAATITKNGENVTEVVAQFENVYDYTPAIEYSCSPKTGDSSNLQLWFALLFVSGGGIIGTDIFCKKRKEEKE